MYYLFCCHRWTVGPHSVRYPRLPGSRLPLHRDVSTLGGHRVTSPSGRVCVRCTHDLSKSTGDRPRTGGHHRDDGPGPCVIDVVRGLGDLWRPLDVRRRYTHKTTETGRVEPLRPGRVDTLKSSHTPVQGCPRQNRGSCFSYVVSSQTHPKTRTLRVSMTRMVPWRPTRDPIFYHVVQYGLTHPDSLCPYTVGRLHDIHCSYRVLLVFKDVVLSLRRPLSVCNLPPT